MKRLFFRKTKNPAYSDVLTGLINRETFLKESHDYLSKNQNSSFIIAFIDIDFFKTINDTYGYESGDRVLVNLAKILSSLMKKNDLIARFNDDEFVLLIKDVENAISATQTISRLSDALKFNIEMDNYDIGITSSIGVSQYPKDAINIEQLLSHADQAMYHSKASGRNMFSFYSEDIRQVQQDADTNMQHLREILSSKNMKGNLYLAYQPLLNGKNHSTELKECEALLRWRDDEGNDISPSVFIQQAEKNNLIDDINRFVIDEVCMQQQIWKEHGDLEEIRVNINLSGNTDIFKDLLDQLKDNILSYELKPQLFGIEVTERTLFDMSDAIQSELASIQKMGMKVAIDDFGRGYSSSEYLSKLPITTLKIDKLFIDDLPTNEYTQKNVDAMISLGHSLNLEIVAEGIETKEQLEYLRDKSCDYIQGFLFKKPISGLEIHKYLST